MAPVSSLPALDTAAANKFGGFPSILSASTDIDVSSPNTMAWQQITNPHQVLNAWEAEHTTRNLQSSVKEPPNEAYLCQPNKEYLFFWTTSFILSVASTMLNDPYQQGNPYGPMFYLHVNPIEEALIRCYTPGIQCNLAIGARLAEIQTQLKHVLERHLSRISLKDLIQDQAMTIPQMRMCYAVMVMSMLIGDICSLDTRIQIMNNTILHRLVVRLHGVGQQAGKITMIFRHTAANMVMFRLNRIEKVILDLKDASSFQTAGIFWDPDTLQVLVQHMSRRDKLLQPGHEDTRGGCLFVTDNQRGLPICARNQALSDA